MDGDRKIMLYGAGALVAAYWLRAMQIKRELAAALEAGGQVQAKLTGYWPYKAGMSAAERLMEGGTKDRKGRPIYTLEQHLQDPVNAPWVSVAGDFTIWPDGQRIVIEAYPGAIFRVVDTGGHFFGAKKVYRVAGYEPLDIAVNGPETYLPRLTTVGVVKGDTIGEGSVNFSRLYGGA